MVVCVNLRDDRSSAILRVGRTSRNQKRRSAASTRFLPEVPAGQNYLYFTEKRDHPEPKFGWRSRYSVGTEQPLVGLQSSGCGLLCVSA